MTEWLRNCQEKFYNSHSAERLWRDGTSSWQLAEIRGQRSDVRDQRTEGSRQIAAGRRQRADDRGQTTEILLWERLSAAIRTTSTI